MAGFPDAAAGDHGRVHGTCEAPGLGPSGFPSRDSSRATASKEPVSSSLSSRPLARAARAAAGMRGCACTTCGRRHAHCFDARAPTGHWETARSVRLPAARSVMPVVAPVTRMTLHPEPSLLPSDLRAATAPVLVARVRIGIRAVVMAILLYGAADWVAHRNVVVPLWLIAAGQLCILGVAAWLLRGLPSRPRIVATVLVTMAALQWSGVASDALSANPMATLFSSVGAAVASGALFPWGAVPQALMAAVVGVTGVLSFVFVQEATGPFAYPAVMCALLLGGSVFLALASERVRRQRALAEAVLTAFTRRAESEARIATVLARAGEVLAAHLDEPDMLDRLHAIAREALEVDWSSAFILEPRTGGYRLVASAGTAHALREPMLPTELPAGWMPAVGADGAFEVQDATELALPRELLARLRAASFVGAPLSCRGRAVGVQLHGYHTRTGAFSADARRLAAGLAHATALAIENARRIVELEAASRLKTEFVATMSHELRTPLNVITGYTEMLADDVLGPLTSAQRDTVTRMRRSADELLELVNATLDVGRLESGRVSIDRRPVDLGTLVAELDVELRPVLSAGVALRWHGDAAPRAVLTDRGKLKTVVKNVVGNACKFTQRGAVDVHLAWDAGELEVVVRDTGVGIAPEQLPHIFDMFRQGDGSATRRFSGVGLGLHIVSRLVELLGGTIAVESAPGVGSRFTIRLPAPMALVVPEGARASG